MILPNKYLSLSASLIGISALLLDILQTDEMPVSALWHTFKKEYGDKKKIKNMPTYNKFALTINFMYMTRMINYNSKGEIFNENIKFKNIKSR